MRFFKLVFCLLLTGSTNLEAKETILFNKEFAKQKYDLDILQNTPKKINSRIIEFNDLENILIKNNNDLKKYITRIEQSEADLKGKYSLWKPKISLKSNGLPKYTSGINNSNLDDNTFTEQGEIELDTTIDWDLINPSRKLEIKIAKENLKNSKLIYENAIDELYFEASKVYFLIQTSKQEIKVAEEAIETSKFALNDAINRFDSGLGNKVEVLEAKTQLGRSKLLLEKRIEDKNLYKDSLAKILNLKGNYRIKDGSDKKIRGLWLHTIDESLTSAYKTRKDLLIDQNNIASNKNKSLLVLSNNKPSLNLYNSFSVSRKLGDSSISSFREQNITNSTSNISGIRFSLKLYDGGLTFQDYKSSESLTKELVSNFEQNKLIIKKNIENTLKNLNSNKNKIFISSSQVDAAKEALQISLKRLNAGITTQREVVNAQSDLSEAESNFINSFYEFNTNISKLRRMTGLEETNKCNKVGENYKDFVIFLKEKNLINCIK